MSIWTYLCPNAVAVGFRHVKVREISNLISNGNANVDVVSPRVGRVEEASSEPFYFSISIELRLPLLERCSGRIPHVKV